LGIVVAAFAVTVALVCSAVAPKDQNWPLELGVVIVVTLLWYQVALRVANKRERFLQTMTAMFVVLLVFSPPLLPLMSAWTAQAKAYETSKVPPAGMLSLAVLALLFWRFLACVRIVRGAFEWPTFPAVLLVLGQEFVMLLVLAALLGAPTQSN
jgi:uncharacterized membrane protein